MNVEYLKAAKLLLGSSRTGEANDPEIYISAIVRVLSCYPLDVVALVVDPADGLPSKLEWLPKPFEVKRACEELYGPTRRRLEREDNTRKQLAERAAREALPKPKQTFEEFCAEMTARGLPIGTQQQRMIEADEVCKKLGITREQFDALPDLPPDHEYWGGRRSCA